MSSEGIKVEVKTKTPEIKPYEPIPKAWPIPADVQLRIHRNTLDYLTAGTLYKIKSVPISDEEKYEYYLQKDAISGEGIFFKIRLKKNLDIRSIASEPKKIQVDMSYNNKIFMVIIATMIAIEILTILFFAGPPEILYYLAPYMNLPTLLGYVLASTFFAIMMYHRATLVKVYTGNFRIIAEQDEPLEFVLVKKHGLWKFSYTKHESFKATVRVFEIQLFYSEKATMHDVFGYGPDDIAKHINEALQKENIFLKEAIQRMGIRIRTIEKQLNITKAEADKAKDAIRDAYFKGAMSTLKRYEEYEKEEKKTNPLLQVLLQNFPLVLLLITGIGIAFSPLSSQMQSIQLDPLTQTLVIIMGLLLTVYLISTWIKTREYKRIEVRT